MFASCATSKSKIAEDATVPRTVPAAAPVTEAVGPNPVSAADPPQTNSAFVPAGGQASLPTLPSNSNSLRFVPRDGPAAAADPARPTATTPTAVSAQPIPASLPTAPHGAVLPTSASLALPQAADDHSGLAAATAQTPPNNLGAGFAPPPGDAKQAVADVLQFALAHHPALRARKSEVDAARARLITARLLPNPQFMVQTASTTNDEDSTHLTTRLMFTIPTGPKRSLRSAVAETGIYEAQMALGRETRVVLSEAADAAIEVLYLQEQAGLYDQLSQLSNKAVEIQKERFKAAAVPYRSVVISELTAYNAELARRNSLAQLNQAKVRLARAMGILDGSPPPVAGQLTADPLFFPPLPAVLARAGRTSPELAESRGAIQESRQQHALERWTAVPDFEIGPRAFDEVSGRPNDRIGGRVQFDVPIFDRNQGRIAESAADIQTNCAKYDMVRVTTLNDVASLYVELQDVQTRLDYFKTKLEPLAAQAETALREAFQDRAVTDFELTDLLESLSRMKLSDLDLRHEHQRLRTRLELLLECPLSSLGGGEPAPTPPPSLEAVPIPPPQEMPAETPSVPSP